MLSFDTACELALKYYKENFGVDGISHPYDVGDSWVFNGGKDGDEMTGIQKISVSKLNGGISEFYLPLPENFSKLDAGTALEIPEKYR